MGTPTRNAPGGLDQAIRVLEERLRSLEEGSKGSPRGAFSPEFEARTERAIQEGRRTLARLKAIRGDEAVGEEEVVEEVREPTPAPSRAAILQQIALGGEEGGQEVPLQRGDSEISAILQQIAGPEAAAGFETIPEPDIGITTAFGAGVKEGFLMPLNIFGREGEELPLDEVGEKAANFLGELVGLGVGFIPFSAGAGLALKGTGLTRSLSKPVRDFLKFSLGGTAQAIGTAEEPEDIPKAALIGLTLGATIDGLYLAAAMRNRARDLGRVAGRNVDTGNPIPDVPASPGTLAKETELAPTMAKSPDRLTDEARALANEERTLEQALIDLAEDHVETVRITDVRDVTPIFSYASRKYPNAQILRRRVIGRELPTPLASAEQKAQAQIQSRIAAARDAGTPLSEEQITREFELLLEAERRLRRGPPGRARQEGEVVHEVLVHNPADPDQALSPRQIAQWQETGTFEGMGLSYRGQMHVATGQKAAPGLVQIKRLDHPATFAVRTSEITNFLTPRVFGPIGARQAQMREVLRTANQIGFNAIRAGVVRRGVVNLRDFSEVRSFSDFIEQNRARIIEFPSESIEESARQFALSQGIRGLREVEEGVTKQLRIFDPEAVRFLPERPRPGLDFDSVQFGPEGNPLLIVPSWKSNVENVLREAGFKAGEVRNFLESHADETWQGLKELMDKDIQILTRLSHAQTGGCL